MKKPISIPKHIGFIMDGNRRWAREKGLPTLEGHRRGYETLRSLGAWCVARGIKYATVFAFSTENWSRAKKEVDYLMILLHRGLTKELEEFNRQGICVRVIGRRRELPARVKNAAVKAETYTKKNKKGTLFIAINYGGRAEIIDATRKVIRSGMRPAQLNEDNFRSFLYASDVPDPDLIIRTSGEQRLSGFLLYESAYSELYFPKKYWPDFNETDLDKALVWYHKRKRRFGN